MEDICEVNLYTRDFAYTQLHEEYKIIDDEILGINRIVSDRVCYSNYSDHHEPLQPT